MRDRGRVRAGEDEERKDEERKKHTSHGDAGKKARGERERATATEGENEKKQCSVRHTDTN